METLRCGLFVILKLANIKGMITCASIRFEKISYEVTYYIAGEQKTVWVNEKEFEVELPEMQKIGFKK